MTSHRLDFGALPWQTHAQSTVEVASVNVPVNVPTMTALSCPTTLK